MRSASSKSLTATLWPLSALSTTIALNAPIARPPSGRLRSNGALDGPFLDRQIDHRRGDAERDRKPPHDAVAAVGLIEHAAEEDAKKAADLVREIGRASCRERV